MCIRDSSSPYQGDLHLYIMSGDPGVTAHRDYGKEYYKRVLGFRPRFMSEFGFISLPEKDSYYRFNVRREPLRNPSEIIRFLPSTKQMLDEGRIEDVIHYSQLFNSMALKFWIEHFRRLKGVCAGSLRCVSETGAAGSEPVPRPVFHGIQRGHGRYVLRAIAHLDPRFLL